MAFPAAEQPPPRAHLGCPDVRRGPWRAGPEKEVPIPYSRSANVHDSLADAYLADGQKDRARQSAQRALELLPGDSSIQDEKVRAGIRQSAEDKLKQLGAAPQ